MNFPLLRGGRSAVRKAPERAIFGRYAGAEAFRRHRFILLTALILTAFFYGFAFALYGPVYFLQFTIPLLLLLAIVVWLLPVTGKPPERLIKRMLGAFIVLNLSWPDYLAIALPGLPWITAIRLISAPLVLVMLIALSVSPEMRREMKHILSASPMIWKLLLVFIAMGGVTIVLSSNIPNSVSKFIVALLNWISIFFVSCYVFRVPGRVKRFANLLWGIALFVCTLGVYELKYSRVPWAGRIPSFLKVDDEGVQRILAGAARTATGIYRVQSRFTTSLGLGEFLGLSVPFILHMAFTTRSLAKRVALIASLPFIFRIIIGTDSRLAAVCFFYSCLFYLLAWGALRWKNNRDSLFGPAIVIGYPAVFTAFFVATFYVRRLHAMVWGSGAQDASTEARKTMYRMGWPKILRNPIGNGMGQGADTLGFYSPSGILTIDTYYLLVALEYGVIGFFAFYGMLILAVWQAGRTAVRTLDDEIVYLAPIAIAMTNFIISKSVFSQQENHSLIFIFLGAIMALVSRQRDIEAEARKRAEILREAAEEPVRTRTHAPWLDRIPAK